MRVGWSFALVATGCGVVQTPGSPGPAGETEPAPAVRTGFETAVPQAAVLYPLDEAVKDALSGPWTYVGTGPWHGIHRVHACAYRNDRVVLVNVYCTIKETRAFRVDLFSPTRGRVRIYAEAKVPLSTLARRDYFSFNGEAEPPPGPETGLPSLALTMSFSELQDYERRRYERFLPSCYGGVEIHRPQGGCLRELAPRAAEWAERNRTFLEQPPDDWYRIVRELRALAATHGKNVQ